MLCNLEVYDRFTVLTISVKELNKFDMTTFSNKLNELITLGHINLIINLPNLKYVTPVFLNILRDIDQLCNERSGKLRIYSPQTEFEQIAYLCDVNTAENCFLNNSKIIA